MHDHPAVAPKEAAGAPANSVDPFNGRAIKKPVESIGNTTCFEGRDFSKRGPENSVIYNRPELEYCEPIGKLAVKIKSADGSMVSMDEEITNTEGYRLTIVGPIKVRGIVWRLRKLKAG